MEMKVWVEGLPKTVCGVSRETTCQDIVKALAHATGIRGRFLLVERWGQSEKPLAPSEQLLHLLQQKGEQCHTVQFILRKTEPTASNGSLSPVSRPATTAEMPFQRVSNLRKSLTSHGTEMSVAKIMKTRGSLPAESETQLPAESKTQLPAESKTQLPAESKTQLPSSAASPISALIRENNLPSDLIDAPSTEKCKENDSEPPLVPVTPYGSDVPLQLEEIKPRNCRPSFDDRSPHNLTHGATSLDHGKNAEKKRQLSVEIRQQKEHMVHTQADEMHFDKELMFWEEKVEGITREEASLEASLQPLRSSEKNVLSNLKELSHLHLEDILRVNRKAEEALKAELASLRSNIVQCQDNIAKADIKARAVAEKIKNERETQYTGHRQVGEAALRQERDRLAKELLNLAVIQDNQTRRLDNIALNEQRIDSTLLAKQLELDSLQVSLKKANFDGFLGGLSVKASAISPDPLLHSESQGRITEEASEENSGRLESKPSPAAPARRAISSQRILVLKRNSTRDPQGMWV